MFLAGKIAHLSPEMIDAIARRVVEHLSEKVVQEIAWEVVPHLAELLIKASSRRKRPSRISIGQLRFNFFRAAELIESAARSVLRGSRRETVDVERWPSSPRSKANEYGVRESVKSQR